MRSSNIKHTYKYNAKIPKSIKDRIPGKIKDIFAALKKDQRMEINVEGVRSGEIEITKDVIEDLFAFNMAITNICEKAKLRERLVEVSDLMWHEVAALKFFKGGKVKKSRSGFILECWAQDG
jgi:cation transport regulator ChaB